MPPGRVWGKHEVALLRVQLMIRNVFRSPFGMILASEGAINKIDEIDRASK